MGSTFQQVLYTAPDGRNMDWQTAAWYWDKAGYDMAPDGSKTKKGAAPAAARTTLGGLGGTLATFGLGGSPGTPAAGGPAMGGGNSTLSQLTDIADPWSSQRGQYQTQLSSLMKDPSSFLQSDLFKASTAAGLEGVNRSAAAGGMLKSGNRLQALMDYGQKNAPDNFFRMADLLSGFGGAKSQNPGGGLSAYANLQNANTSAYNAETSRFNADTSRKAQEQGVNQFNIQQQQQKQDLDQLTQWQQQQQQAQQQQQNSSYWNDELNRIKARSQAEDTAHQDYMSRRY